MSGLVVRVARQMSRILEARAWRRLCSPANGIEPLVAPLDAPALRRASRALVALLLSSPRLGRPAREMLVREMRRASPCCEVGSSQRRLIEALFGPTLCDRAEEPKRTGPRARSEPSVGRAQDVVGWLESYLRAQRPARAVLVCESLARVALLGMLRHDLLTRARSHMRLKAPPLAELQLGAYPECDLDCRGCYSARARQARPPTASTVARIVDQAAACGALAIHVVGPGEPFYSPERARELCELAAARPHLLFTIATNGSRFDEPLASRLGEIGNVVLVVSVEGPREAHDARRGRGSFDRACRTLERMHRHGLLYGFACMVGAHNHQAVLEPAWLAQMAKLGCALGVYSRYFPLEAGHADELLLDPAARRQFGAALTRARSRAAMPLIDLDEVEAQIGCRSRAGASVYVDASSGAVTPCIRMPFSPATCRLAPELGRTLGRVLEDPFFLRYRSPSTAPSLGCGDDLAGELGRLRVELGRHDCPTDQLARYQDRAHHGAWRAISHQHEAT